MANKKEEQAQARASEERVDQGAGAQGFNVQEPEEVKSNAVQLPNADRREISSPRGSVAVFGPDPKTSPEGPFGRQSTAGPRVSNFRMSDFDNPGLQRLAAISGRSIDGMAPMHEGDQALGFMHLLNVETLEQITLLPGGRVPEGTFVSVRHVPEEFLASLGREE